MLETLLNGPEFHESDDIPLAQLFCYEQVSTATETLTLIEGIFPNVRHSIFKHFSNI